MTIVYLCAISATMSNDNKTKINSLTSHWPRGTIAAASYLEKQGYSHNLLTRYKKSKWIKSFGRGAYKLFIDDIEWQGTIYTLQNQLNLNFHPGGKTALEIKGHAHYLSKTKKIFLFGIRGQTIPTWFLTNKIDVDFVITKTNLFPPYIRNSLSIHKYRDFSIKISSLERATMEMLYHVPAKVSFAEATLITENMISLRPNLVQNLLENCNSIKVKRLFMYLVEKHELPWVPKIDLSNVYFGEGKRSIVQNGKLDKKYLITVPLELNETAP